jgi:hemoglobin
MNDIQTRDDIMFIMRSFYDKLLADETIAYIFTEVAQINLEEHFPVLVDFWDSILFGSGTYRNNAMQVHIDLAKKSPLTPAHFKTWLNYLIQSIEDDFEGYNAHVMKARAQNIAGLMEFKTQGL